MIACIWSSCARHMKLVNKVQIHLGILLVVSLPLKTYIWRNQRFFTFKNPCWSKHETLKASACLMWFVRWRDHTASSFRGSLLLTATEFPALSRFLQFQMTVPDWGVNYKNRRRDGCVCCCLTINVKLNLDILHSVYSWKWMALSLIFLLTIFHLYTVDLLHSDTAMLQILPFHVIFQLHFLRGLMPFLNCFKVWLGNLTHSLKQYMWKLNS